MQSLPKIGFPVEEYSTSMLEMTLPRTKLTVHKGMESKSISNHILVWIMAYILFKMQLPFFSISPSGHQPNKKKWKFLH